ncbi:MAG TPA: TonB-dependent receptor, partial [Candidatus Eisenbacteria bacterium]|nr:TonB-dependent receptor [Candidatus Eisenbacteria bacterium]
MRLLLPLAVSLLLAAGARASSLDGFIRSKEGGESIAFARVLLRADSTVADSGAATAVARTLANASGYYAIVGVEPGTYRLQVRAVGYKERADVIRIGEAPLRLDVELETAPFQVPTVSVKADSMRFREADIQPGFTEISAKRLASIPAVGEQDIIRSLQLLPGIQSASDVSSGLYIRGGGPDQTLILLDQIPLYNPTHAFGFFSTFNPSAIKDVALYKGAYPANYGGRLGAVLDVSNRDGNRNALHGQGGISLIAARATLEGPIRDGSWILSGRRTYLDPILAAVRDDSTEIPDYYFYDMNARVNRSFGSSDNVMLSGYRGRDDLFLDLDTGSFVDIRWGNMAGTGRWSHRFGPGLFGNFLVAASEYTSETKVSIFSTPIQFSNRLLDVSLKADLDWRPAPAHQIDAGVLAARYRFEFDQEFNGVPQQPLDEQPISLSLYAEDQWALSTRSTLRPGLRLERFGESSRWVVEPRLSGSVLLDDRLRLKAGGGGYTQHLQLVSTEGFSGADFWVPTDETAEPGRSWQAVLGLEWTVSPKHLLSVESYYTTLRNLVQLDVVRAPDAQETTTEDLFYTGGTGWASGVEIFAEQRTGPLTGWIGYTLGWSRRRWDEVNQGSTFPPKYDRRHDLKLVADYKVGRWSYNA